MPLIPSAYQNKHPLLLNGHLQTIVPALFRKITLHSAFNKERIHTPDHDFLDLEWYVASSAKLVVISHGLEGDSQRPYMLGMVKHLVENNYNVLCWNYRSCSGEMNLQKRFYHLGATDDLNLVIDHVLQQDKYKEIYLMGFSAGGNLTLKYLGEQGQQLHKNIIKTVVFSVPCHLSSGASYLKRWQNYMYERRFMKSLKRKVKEKHSSTPHQFDLDLLSQTHHIWDFDENFTAPIHGFEGAEDYYRQVSSVFFIPKIKIPTLILSALNDPFLPTPCYPFSEADSSKNVFLETPNTGGHCGFYAPKVYYSEKRALDFIQNH